MRKRGLLLCVALAGCAARTPEQPSVARARAALLGAASRRGDLQLGCEPADAEVWLDGVPQGMCTDFSGTPTGLKVGEGMHRVEVRKEGFLPYVTFLSPSGARTSLQVNLVPSGKSEGANR